MPSQASPDNVFDRFRITAKPLFRLPYITPSLHEQMMTLLAIFDRLETQFIAAQMAHLSDVRNARALPNPAAPPKARYPGKALPAAPHAPASDQDADPDQEPDADQDADDTTAD